MVYQLIQDCSLGVSFNNGIITPMYGAQTIRFFKYKKVLWELSSDINGNEGVSGPYCPVENCRTRLDLREDHTRVINDSNTSYATCRECGRKFTFDYSPQELQGRAEEKHFASERLHYEVISLDMPPTKIGSETEDDNFWINVRFGQSGGKKVAIIYIGEKKKNQSQKDKAQIFIDLDDEQMRHDPSNMPPGEILGGIKVRFRNSVHGAKYGDEKKEK